MLPTTGRHRTQQPQRQRRPITRATIVAPITPTHKKKTTVAHNEFLSNCKIKICNQYSEQMCARCECVCVSVGVADVVAGSGVVSVHMRVSGVGSLPIDYESHQITCTYIHTCVCIYVCKYISLLEFELILYVHMWTQYSSVAQRNPNENYSVARFRNAIKLVLTAKVGKRKRAK